MPLFDRKAEAEPVLECPHDATPMKKLRVGGGVDVDRCETCGGTWFDAKELARSTKDEALESLAKRVPVNSEDSPFRCPRCKGRCVEGRVGEVEVDHCLECGGLWLDRGELAEAKRRLHAERRATANGLPSLLSQL